MNGTPHPAGKKGSLFEIGFPPFQHVELEGQVIAAKGLPVEEVQAVVCAAFVPLTSCLDDAYQGDGPSGASLPYGTSTLGTFGLTLTIGERGGVDAAEVIAGTLLGEVGGLPAVRDLKSCLMTFARTLRFSKPIERRAHVTYGLNAEKNLGKTSTKLIETRVDAGLTMPDDVRRIVRWYFPAMRSCYEQGLTMSPGLKGQVTSSFAIAPEGSVTSFSVTGGSMRSPSMNACLAGVFAKLPFPPSTSGFPSMTFAIDFQADGPL